MIPVIDLRTYLKLPPKQSDQPDVIIILNIYGRRVGMIVDSVRDVIYIPNQEITQLTETLNTIDIAYIEGVIHLQQEIVMLLNLETLINQNQIQAIYRGIDKGRNNKSSDKSVTNT